MGTFSMLECFLKHCQVLCHVTLSIVGSIRVTIALTPQHETFISIMFTNSCITLVPTLKACEKTM